jgi:hypothetical protein
MKTIHARLKGKRGETTSLEIPIDEEIEKIAMRMHKAGVPCLENILGWKVFYRPPQQSSIKSHSVDPFTGVIGKESAAIGEITPAEFTFGYDAPWKIVLSWVDGGDKPPKWFRYGEDKIIQDRTGQLF